MLKQEDQKTEVWMAWNASQSATAALSALSERLLMGYPIDITICHAFRMPK